MCIRDRRITAFFFDILVTPIDSTIVTTVARPSGMAATARLTAISSDSSTVLKPMLTPRAASSISVIANIATQINLSLIHISAYR